MVAASGQPPSSFFALFTSAYEDSFATPVMLQTASNPMSPVHSLPELQRIFGLKI
jgi:hypothetical protein